MAASYRIGQHSCRRMFHICNLKPNLKWAFNTAQKSCYFPSEPSLSIFTALAQRWASLSSLNLTFNFFLIFSKWLQLFNTINISLSYCHKHHELTWHTVIFIFFYPVTLDKMSLNILENNYSISSLRLFEVFSLSIPFPLYL